MDEAGDTGWSLTAPYGKRGSSRFLILAAVVIPAGKNIHIQRVVAGKSNVNNALRIKSESLYTHMAEQLLYAELAKHTVVDFYPDARTLKQKDRHALPNYLETRLAIGGHPPTITTIPSESGALLEIQCADVISAILFAHYERSDSACLNILAPAVTITKLY